VCSPIPSPAPSVGPSATPSPADSDQEGNEKEEGLENDDQPEDNEVEDDEEDDKVEDNDQEDEVEDNQEDKMGDNQEVQVEAQAEEEAVWSEDKEDDIDNFMMVGGRDPIVKEDVCGWSDLRDQIEMDLVVAHKDQKSLMTLNKLLVLRNFATLRIRGIGHIATSMQIAMQMMDGVGTHLTRHICFIARHYQLFEQLPPEK
jgi:hypothetical protein